MFILAMTGCNTDASLQDVAGKQSITQHIERVSVEPAEQLWDSYRDDVCAVITRIDEQRCFNTFEAVITEKAYSTKYAYVDGGAASPMTMEMAVSLTDPESGITHYVTLLKNRLTPDYRFTWSTNYVGSSDGVQTVVLVAAEWDHVDGHDWVKAFDLPAANTVESDWDASVGISYAQATHIQGVFQGYLTAYVEALNKNYGGKQLDSAMFSEDDAFNVINSGEGVVGYVLRIWDQLDQATEGSGVDVFYDLQGNLVDHQEWSDY